MLANFFPLVCFLEHSSGIRCAAGRRVVGISSIFVNIIPVEQSDVLDPITKRLPVRYMDFKDTHLIHKSFVGDFVKLRRPENPSDFDDLTLVPDVLTTEDPSAIIFPPAYVHLLDRFGIKKFAPYPNKVQYTKLSVQMESAVKALLNMRMCKKRSC